MQENEEWKRAQLCHPKAGWDKRELLVNGAAEHRTPGMQIAGIPNGLGWEKTTLKPREADAKNKTSTICML